MSLLTPKGAREAKAALPDRKGPRVTVSISLADYELDELAWRFVGEIAEWATDNNAHLLRTSTEPCGCRSCLAVHAARILVGRDDD